MSTMTLKERLRARREKLKETTDDDASPRKLLPNEDEDPSENTAEGEGESKESEGLMSDLKKRRRRAQKELTEAMKGGEDEGESMAEKMKARRRSRQRLKSKTDTEAEATATGEETDTLRPLTSTQQSATLSKSLGGTLEGTSESEGGKTLRGAARSKNLRASLKEKIKAARDKGKDEAYDETRETGRKLKGKRNLPTRTRFDDRSMLKKEDYELEEMLEKSIAARSKWKETNEKKTSFLPSQQEAFDFFTMVWEPDPEEDQAVPTVELAKPAEEEPADKEVSPEGEAGPSGEQPPEEAEEAKEETEEDKKKKEKKKKKDEDKPEDEQPLIERYDEATPAPWEFYQVGRSEYKPFHDKMVDESKMYFVPSMRAAPTQDKVFELPAPRYLEEEGFYVGTKPAVSLRNVSRMENRLLKQKDVNAEWFGEDGRIISLPDPLKEVPSRPIIPEEPDPMLKVDFKKAVITDFDNRLIDGSIEGSGRYQLDVDINTVAFTHHHLFSREHVLAAKLTAMFNYYVQRSKKKTVLFLTDKLKALKNASSHVQENINLMRGDNRSSEKALVDQESRLKDYRDEIKLARKERDQEMSTDRNVMKNIIDTWKEIKNLRQFQGYTNTTVKLKIQKEAVDRAADEKEWAEDVEDELAELREEAEAHYQRRLEEYRTNLEAWKKQKQLKKEAGKRQKKRDRRLAQGAVESVDEGEDDLALEEADRRLLDESDLEKPEKPVLMDVAEEKARITARYQTIRRQPGEARLYPEVSSGATISQNNLCARGEQQRRSDINRYKIYVKVLFNGKEVSRTSPRPLGQDFTVRFAQIFNVQIVQWPESITIEVYETAGLTTDRLAEVFAVIPEANVTAETVQLDNMDFSSDARVNHSHEGVGSGVNISFDASNANLLSLLTTGSLTMSVAWAVNEDGAVLVPPTAPTNHVHSAIKSLDAVAAIGAAGVSDMDQLSKWIAQSRLDPNDPSNAELMHRVKPGAGGDFEIKGHFRLEQMQEEFNFTTEEDLVKNRRFQAIQLREQEVPEFRGLKLLPATEPEVPDDLFDEYDKKRREEDKVRQQDISSHRVAVNKFMQKVREQVMERVRKLQHQKVLSDMVYEESVPNIGTIVPNLLKMTEPRRPLKPVRKERKKMTAQNLKQENVRLLINIVRAFDIPVRQDALQSKPRATDNQGGASMGQDTLNRSLKQGTIKNIAGEDYRMFTLAKDFFRAQGIPFEDHDDFALFDLSCTLVRPFVEVMFQRHTQTTTVAEGPNPSWNEELQIPFRAPNEDYSTSSLQSVKDILYISLFDECVVDVLKDDRQRGTNIHRRIERRWLGSLKIPFSTIYHNSRIEGTFRVDKPSVLLGYQHDPGNRSIDGGLDVGVSHKDQTFLTMFITVEPQLTPVEHIREKFDTNEDEKLVSEGEKWLTDLEARFPKREYKTTVVDINGMAVFITRYFKALAPPEQLTADQNQRDVAEILARYVALIPFVSDSVSFPGICDIWSTCDQFIQMLQGDEEEHAVLLMCFFLHMNKQAYLLLGSAIPEGPTAYVLTKEDKDYWIWNASTGEHFSYRDNYCPVQSVGCLVNADNIWANIQPNDQPCRIQFDLKNTAHWKPFFHKGFPHPGLTTVQPERLIYMDTDKDFLADVQDKVERALREKIMEWRPRHITRWNRYCVQAFRQILPKLEASRGKALAEHMTELDQLIGSYKLSGFPINMAYTDLEPLVEAVYATGVHINETDDVEFALAVYVHPYPCSVLSVWVYVASLIRKR